MGDRFGVLNVSRHNQPGGGGHLLGYFMKRQQMITGAHRLTSQTHALHNQRERMRGPRHNFRREADITPLLQAYVQYRGSVRQHADRVRRHLVLTKKQLAGDKRFDQLGLRVLELISLNELNTCLQTAQPHSGIEKTAATHRLPVLVAKAASIIRHGSVVWLTHQKNPPAPPINTTTGTAVAVEATNK